MGRVNVSFKNNNRDKNLEKIVKSAHDKSAFVKDCIEFYLEYRDKDFNNPKEEKTNIETNEIDTVDWEF